jgi:hypothetical protein
MNETQLAAQQLATAIARFRLAERDASRALIIAECSMNNVAGQHGVRVGRSITQPVQDLDLRVQAATLRVRCGVQLPD